MAARRMIRNWTESEKVDTLSAEGERFFTRLMMVADDYGSFPEHLQLIKSKCFPMKDKLSAVKVAEWLDELITADIVFKYSVDGKQYIRIKNFDQRVQSKKNIYPHPLENGDPRKKTVDHGGQAPELEREVEQNKKEKVKENVIEIGEPTETSILIKAKYAGEKPRRIYNLTEYFRSTGQLDEVARAGWAARFGLFMNKNPGAVFNDDSHLYNAMKRFDPESTTPKKPTKEEILATLRK